MKKHILLVDDEKHVLDAMKRVLRPLCEEWEVTFASSGEEALDLLAEQQFDVVVSDARMPGMSGAELLSHVHEKYPHILRVILSGEVGVALEGRSLNTAHQVLSKPCSPKELLDAIKRAYMMLKQSATNTEKKQIMALRLSDAFETVASVLRQKITPSDELDPTALAKYIAADTELTGRLRHCCLKRNFQQEGDPPETLVHTLGVDTMFSVVLFHRLETYWGPLACPEFSIGNFWRRSLVVARSTLALNECKKVDSRSSSDAFAAGLFHVVGRLILAAGRPEDYKSVIVDTEGDDSRLQRKEKEVFGVDSETIGAWYLKRWGYSEAVCDAVRCQRHPGQCLHEHKFPLAPLHVARELIYHDCYQYRDIFDMEFLESMDLGEKLIEWTKTVSEAVAQ